MELMIRTIREAGAIHSMIGRVISSLSARQRNLEGTAQLTLQCGATVPVRAALTFASSAFLTRGEGHFQCSERVGFDAMNSDTWLALAFEGEAPLTIAVTAVKASAGQCRCLFEVKS